MAMEEDSALDVEALVSGYTGHNRVNRLMFIADKKQGTPAELEALRMAHDEVKKTENLAAYGGIVERIGSRLGQAYTLDRAWVANVERSCKAKLERLESELAGHKANLLKESIRMGHMDLGDQHYAQGDLQAAFKSYVRARDYCSTGRHIIQMCLAIIRLSVEMGNYLHLGNHVAKAENTPDAQSDPVVMAKLAAASGLSMLAGKRYKQAARKLLEVTADLSTTFNDVLAMQDVALYASLCALATFDRDELQRRLVSSIAFKELLETVPEMRDIVMDFHGCRYARALSALTALAPTLALDVHLEPHANSLLHQIRQRALVQYTSPFTSVRLSTMATAFNTSEADLAKEVAALIMDGQVAARIDAHAGVLYAKQVNQRTTTFAKVLAMSDTYIRETKAALLRIDLLKNDFVQKPRGGIGRMGQGPPLGMGFEGLAEGGGGGGAGGRFARILRGGMGAMGIGQGMPPPAVGEDDDELMAGPIAAPGIPAFPGLGPRGGSAAR